MQGLNKIVPSWPEVARETLIVLGGALAAAVIIGNLPTVRQWMKDQWAGSNPTV
jgi:hypothetical protein